MNFYTYDYLVKQINSSQNMKFIVAAIFGVILVALAFQFAHHRDDNKYRDLIIIFVLCGILLLGIQFTNYQQSQSSTNQASQMTSFLRNLSKDKKVKTSEISCNQTTLTNQMVVKIKKDYYQVLFNSDFSSYQLVKAALVNKDINFIK
ncbi:DUF3290 domain-containing protein [Xylocopilactobacillus apis]|uniref:DUF3290 domain-containing protein n=1 Tax=Xylocopilactobacillus apis TaxID=2932183 RepID=A0AAU9DDD7_9LACO|nr:DUF3290 domain-containing protein [Xylocopilactobacillus apis]BDR56161.1 hypothetical protein KIMC2_07230 [Xylocopilactobacillus apis]